MSRQFLTLLLLSALAGCATTSGNSYRYDGTGDYYYGSAGADVVIDSTPGGYGYGGFGYGGGFGHGYGYGGGFGYGYGYPRYSSLFYPWGYGWSPIWWSPPIHVVIPDGRGARVQHDRAQRSSLLTRPVANAPESASYAPRTQAAQAAALRSQGRFESGQRQPPVATRSWRSRSATGAVPNRSSQPAAPQPRPSMSAPSMRVAPPPARTADRKQ